MVSLLSLLYFHPFLNHDIVGAETRCKKPGHTRRGHFLQIGFSFWSIQAKTTPAMVNHSQSSQHFAPLWNDKRCHGGNKWVLTTDCICKGGQSFHFQKGVNLGKAKKISIPLFGQQEPLKMVAESLQWNGYICKEKSLHSSLCELVQSIFIPNSYLTNCLENMGIKLRARLQVTLQGLGGHVGHISHNCTSGRNDTSKCGIFQSHPNWNYVYINLIECDFVRFPCLSIISSFYNPRRGHVQRRPLQLPVPGDLRLPGPPHLGAPGVRRAARQGSAPLGSGVLCRGLIRWRPTREHHLPCQTLPVQSGAALPARARGGQVHEAEVPLVPRPRGAVTRRLNGGWLAGWDGFTRRLVVRHSRQSRERRCRVTIRSVGAAKGIVGVVTAMFNDDSFIPEFIRAEAKILLYCRSHVNSEL